MPNGLRVLLREDHSWPLVTVQSWVNVGSVDETATEAGLAHVLEHMVFKGTRSHRTAEISRWVEAQGGALNAETSKEYTHYYIDMPSRGPACRQAGTRQAVHLMAELLCGATLDAREWKRERPVILEEMKRRNDDAETMAWELLQEALYKDPAHARSVIGTPETVSTFSAATVKRFYDTHYTATNSLVVVAGDFQSHDVLGWLKREFRKMPRNAPRQARARAILQPQGLRKVLKKPVQQAYAIYAFPTPPADHPDHEALDLLAIVLGEGRDARLVDALREKRKLVWSVGASNMTQEGPGLFAVFAEFDVKHRRNVHPAVQRVLRGLLRHPPTSQEMRRAKNLMQTSWLQGYETFHNQASALGAYALENHLDRLRGYLPKILSLERRDIVRVIRTYFAGELSGAVVEP